jgi:ribosomal protein S24E
MNILEWLKEHGYGYTWNFRIGTRTPDVIAFNDNEIIVFEFKKYATELSNALGQCLFYRRKANKSFIVLNSEEIGLIPRSSLGLLKKYGVGLLGINKNIKIIINSKFSKFTDKKLLKKLRDRSVDSIASPLVKASGEEIKQKIIDLLKEHPEGLPILEIAKLIGMHRHTVTKYIYHLIGTGAVHQRDVAAAKLCYLSSTSAKSSKEKELLEKLKKVERK